MPCFLFLQFQKLVIPKRTYIRSDSLDYSLCSKSQPQEYDSEDNFARSPWWWYSYPEKKKDIQNIIQVKKALFKLFGCNYMV